jgi:hypothetical protein
MEPLERAAGQCEHHFVAHLDSVFGKEAFVHFDGELVALARKLSDTA